MAPKQGHQGTLHKSEILPRELKGQNYPEHVEEVHKSLENTGSVDTNLKTWTNFVHSVAAQDVLQTSNEIV